MAAFFRRNRILSAALSLILLAASVAAPFRTHAFGRTILFGSGYHSAHSMAVIRVRAVVGGGFAQGFRAVVGLSKGGAGSRSAELPARTYRSRPSSSLASTHPSHQCARLTARPHPPLRC